MIKTYLLTKTAYGYPTVKNEKYTFPKHQFYIFILSLIFLFVSKIGNSQNIEYWNPSLEKLCNPTQSSNNWIVLKDTSQINIESFINLELPAIGLGGDDTLELVREHISANEIHRTYKQYHKGIEVKNSLIHFHEKNGRLQLINGDWSFNLNQNTQSITDSVAVEIAKLYLPAQVYQWEDSSFQMFYIQYVDSLNPLNGPNVKTYFTKIDNAFSFNSSNTILVKEVALAGVLPYFNKAIQIDAKTGLVFREIDLNKSCVAGNTCTPNLGNKAINFTFDSLYYLEDTCRGNGIIT